MTAVRTTHFLRSFCAFLLLLMPLSSVLAGVSQLTIAYSPAAPVGNQPFQILVTTTPCDVIGTLPPPPTVEQMGNVVRLTVNGALNAPPLCVVPVQTYTFTAPALAPGSYVLEIYYRHLTIPGVVTFRQAAPLVVSGGATQSVPATSMGALVLIALFVCVLGACRLGRLS